MVTPIENLNLKDFNISVILNDTENLDISDEVYFSAEYSDYISNSRLGLVDPKRKGSYKNFLEGFKTSTLEAFELGSSVHALTLEPDKYFLSEYIKPSGKVGKIVELVYKYRNNGYALNKALKKAVEETNYYYGILTPKKQKKLLEEGLDYYMYLLHRTKTDKNEIILSSSVRNTCLNCYSSIATNKVAQKLMFTGDYRCEDTIVTAIKVSFKDEEDKQVELVLKLKIKIDNWVFDNFTDKIILNDLKTTGHSTKYFPGCKVLETGEIIEGSFQKFRYDLQLAFYRWVLTQWLLVKYPDRSFIFDTNIICVSTIPNYESTVYKVPQDMLDESFKYVKKLLMYAAYAIYKKEEICPQQSCTMSTNI